jgi:hypothetical protein
MSGYVLEQPVVLPPPDRVMAWGYFVVATGPSTEPELNIGVSVQPQPNGAPYRMVQLQPVGRLVPLAAPPHRLLEKPIVPSGGKGRGEGDAVQQQLANVITLRPVQSGQNYRITSPPARGLVRPELAEALETVFERFAHEHGFTAEKPLEIRLTRGFKAGSHGHGEGRAADIVTVDGKGLLEWKQEWDRTIAASEKLSDPQQQAEAIAAEQPRNLGYRLYKALQEHGGWRVNQGRLAALPGRDAIVRPVDGDGRAMEDSEDQGPESLSAPASGRPAVGVPSASGPYSCGEVGYQVMK